MIIKKMNIMFFILFFLNESFLYLFGSRNYTMVVSIIAFVYGLLRIKHIILHKYYFKVVILLLILINLISLFYSKFEYGQPISTGLIGTHYFFIYFLYFFFIDMLKSKKNKILVEDVIKFAINFSVFVSVLSCLQSLLYPHLVFLHVDIGERNGGVRFFQLLGPVIFGYILTLGKLLEKYSNKYLLLLLFQFFCIYYVGRTRSVILYLLIGTIVTIVISYKKHQKLKWILMLFTPTIVLAGSSSLMSSSFYQNYIGSVFTQITDLSGTIATRYYSYNYYYELFIQNVLFGIGSIVSQYDLSSEILLTNNSFYLGDLYIVGFIFKYGILGLLWIIYFLFKLIKLYRIWSKQSQFSNLIVFKICGIISLILINEINSKVYVLYTVFFLVFCEPLLQKKDNDY